VPRIRAEAEVEEGVDQRGRVDRPLHHRLVGLSKLQELGDGQDFAEFPVGERVVHVEQLEGRPGGLKDEDECESDDGEPEVVAAQLPGAARRRLDQQAPPWDEEEHDGDREGEHEGREVEEEGHALELSAAVHAHDRVLRPPGDNIPVWVLGPGSELAVEGRGGGEPSAQQPDQRDVQAVRPGPGHLVREVPLAVLREEVEGQEQGRRFLGTSYRKQA